MSLLPDFVKNIPDFGISLKLLLTTGLIPAGLLHLFLNAVITKNKIIFELVGRNPHKQGSVLI